MVAPDPVVSVLGKMYTGCRSTARDPGTGHLMQPRIIRGWGGPCFVTAQGKMMSWQAHASRSIGILGSRVEAVGETDRTTRSRLGTGPWTTSCGSHSVGCYSKSATNATGFRRVPREQQRDNDAPRVGLDSCRNPALLRVCAAGVCTQMSGCARARKGLLQGRGPTQMFRLWPTVSNAVDEAPFGYSQERQSSRQEKDLGLKSQLFRGQVYARTFPRPTGHCADRVSPSVSWSYERMHDRGASSGTRR